MRIYKQQGKTRFNPADDLRDTFSKKEIDFLCTRNDNSPLYKLEANRGDYLWSWHVDHSSICRSPDWIKFHRVDDFIVTMYKLLNGNKLNLSKKDSKLLYKIVDKVALIKVRNILAKEYENFLDNEWIG